MEMRTGLQLYEPAGQPCRNFNILASAVVNDPLDGREKLVLSNFAAGGTGNLIFIDTLTGEGESIPLPADEGAWGLLNWHNEKLIVGTCPRFAYLHSLDLKTRTWAEPLKDTNEKYFWDIVLGSDGMVYGGTWPGCSLLRYDPVRHTLENMGRVSDNPKNLYSRYLNGAVPGYILIAGGYDTQVLKAWDIEKRTFTDFGIPGAKVREVTDEFICIEKDDEQAFYDPRTFEQLQDEGLAEKLTPQQILLPNGKKNRFLRLAGGRMAGVRGQDYFILDNADQTPELRRIPAPAPATAIHTLTTDAGGRIWGSCGFGQTIFYYGPEDGSYWNSSSVCDSGGEVYGMQFVEGRLFLSAYAGGDHIVYDPSQPWDQLNNVNPRTLRPVAPALIRPEGRSVLGPDGCVWTGWSAKYGTYGGGLSRIHPDTLEVDSWYDPITEQQVAGVTADRHYIYFTTNGGASGLAYKEEPCHFGVWSPEGQLVYSHRFEGGQRTGNALLAHGGDVFVGVGNEIRIFDPGSLQFIHAVPVEERCSWMIAADDRRVGAFCGERLLLINAATGEIESATPLPGPVRAATVTASGIIYFAVGSTLYRFRHPAAEGGP